MTGSTNGVVNVGWQFKKERKKEEEEQEVKNEREEEEESDWLNFMSQR